MNQLFHGIDIGGTKIELASYDEALRIRFRKRVSTPTHDFNDFLEAVARLIVESERQCGGPGMVGVGLPGVVDVATGCHLSANVPALCGRNVAEELAGRILRPVVVGNDCHCFALSEANGGAATHAQTMFGLVLGTGAAGGYCVNGRLLRGASGVLGEFGHAQLPGAAVADLGLKLLACPCGLTGCVERYVSGSGLQVLHAELTGRESTGPQIVRDAKRGQLDAVRVLDVHAQLLARAIAGLILHLDPHVIVLGGGLSGLGHLYQVLPDLVARHLFSGAHVPPIVAPMFGDAGGTRGAALLASMEAGRP